MHKTTVTFTTENMPEELTRLRVILDRQSGLPTTLHGVKPSVRPSKTATVHHGLEGPVTFYGVVEAQLGVLVTLSDGKATRYYWFSGSRRDTHLAPGGSSDTGGAISLLYKTLCVDHRVNAKVFYKQVVSIFAEQLRASYANPRLAVYGVPTANGLELVTQYESSLEIGPNTVRIWLAHPRSIRHIDLPVANHPLEAIIKARNV